MLLLLTPWTLVGPPGYTECLKAVREGRTVFLDVGQKKGAEFRAEKLEGFPPGRYKCWLEKGEPVMSRFVEEVKPLPQAPPALTPYFPSPYPPNCRT